MWLHRCEKRDLAKLTSQPLASLTREKKRFARCWIFQKAKATTILHYVRVFENTCVLERPVLRHSSGSNGHISPRRADRPDRPERLLLRRLPLRSSLTRSCWGRQSARILVVYVPLKLYSWSSRNYVTHDPRDSWTAQIRAAVTPPPLNDEFFSFLRLLLRASLSEIYRVFGSRQTFRDCREHHKNHFFRVGYIVIS